MVPSRVQDSLSDAPALKLEHLETRLAPAANTFTWTGGGVNNNWNNPANWSGGVPTGITATATRPLGFSRPHATRRRACTKNNLAAGAVFDSISIDALNFTFERQCDHARRSHGRGQRQPPGAVSAAATRTIALNSLQLTAGPSGSQQFFTINSAATLTVTGQLSGSSGSTG